MYVVMYPSLCCTEIIEVVVEGRGRASSGGDVSMDTVFTVVRDLSRGLAEVCGVAHPLLLELLQLLCSFLSPFPRSSLPFLLSVSVVRTRTSCHCNSNCHNPPPPARWHLQKLSFAALMLTIEEGRVDLFPMVRAPSSMVGTDPLYRGITWGGVGRSGVGLAGASACACRCVGRVHMHTKTWSACVPPCLRR
jgi:hypothetical protein